MPINYPSLENKGVSLFLFNEFFGRKVLFYVFRKLCQGFLDVALKYYGLICSIYSPF